MQPETFANDSVFRVECDRCLDTGFLNQKSTTCIPDSMSEPARNYWRPVLDNSDFCNCEAGRSMLLVFRLESEPPECSAVGCFKPAVFNLQHASKQPLCEVHEMERETQP